MKTFEQLLDEYEKAVQEEQIEQSSPLRHTCPSYLKAAKEDMELARRKLLAYNQKYHINNLPRAERPRLKLIHDE